MDMADVEDRTSATCSGRSTGSSTEELDMLAARDTADFLPLSIELYGSRRRSRARPFSTGSTAPPPGKGDERIDAEQFHRARRGRTGALSHDRRRHRRSRRDRQDHQRDHGLRTGPHRGRRGACRSTAPALHQHEVGTASSPTTTAPPTIPWPMAAGLAG